MGTKQFRHWECDNCFLSEDTPASNTKNDKFMVIWWNMYNPLGSFDADGWDRALLCKKCWALVTKQIDNGVFDERPDDNLETVWEGPF